MIDKIKENWEKILLILKEEHEVSDVSYRTWLQPLTPYSFKGNTGGKRFLPVYNRQLQAGKLPVSSV